MDEHSGGPILAWIGNGASVAAVFSTLIGWLPPVAAVIAFIWYCIQIYESKTIQRHLEARRVRKIAALRAQIIKLEALSLLMKEEED